MFRNNQLCIRVALLLWFVMSSWAIMVTSPSQGTTWSSTGEHTVSWVEVDTDPPTFAISLVQLGVFKQILVPNVDGTQGSVTFSATLPTGSDFQVNIIKSAQETDTILAQSPQIDITSSGPSSTSSSSSPPPSTASSSSSSSSPNSSTSSSSTPASSTKSTNGTPGNTSDSPPSITPSASSPASSGVSNSNNVNGPSSSPTTLITTPPSPTSETPNPGSSITRPATSSNSSNSSNSSTSSNSGATSSLVSLEPTSSGATRSFAISVSDAICFVLVLTNLWTSL